MSYTVPEMVQDGRYIVKCTAPKLVTLYNVVVTKDNDYYSLKIPTHDTTLNTFDESLIDDAVTQSKEWFQKEMSREIISNYFQPSVDDGILQAEELKNARGRSQVVFFGSTKEITDFVPGSTYNVLLQLEGLWFLKRSFGPIWKIVQARAKKEVQPAECLIRDEDSD